MPKLHFQVYSLSTTSPILSTEVLLIFDPHAKSSKSSYFRSIHHESVSLPFSTPSSLPSNLEHLGYIRSKSRVKKACSLAKKVRKNIQRPFTHFTNDVVGIWIREGLLRWERGCIPCKIDESILDVRTLETGNGKGEPSKYQNEREAEENGDYGFWLRSVPSQHSLGRSTRESNRHLSRARSTHHPGWSLNSSFNPSKGVSSSIPLSRNSSSNPRHKSRSHSRPRSHSPSSSYHGRSSFHDSAISISNDDIDNDYDYDYDYDDDDDDDDDTGSSISRSDRSSYYSSPPSSHQPRSHSPTTQAPPLLSDLPSRRAKEEDSRKRIFEKKKAEYWNSSSRHHRSPSSSSSSSSSSDSQSRSRARSRKNQNSTQESHIPRFNNPLQLSVAGSDPSVRR
ncbi:hypothetical protein BOTCAL_0211g00030 [Botryotinia calthae]|uniref:Uncharacterized protein n=1 Tax=Botryotinia calthae TaxID=38488 RepID=A0A4Y8CYP9_9HELO|nr:hypothetical protein BOTCAL_0211g00030 [Botryotinia calthae]